jgi:seryl-tRNA synthetase
VLLNLALINYALSFLVRRGFTPVQTPFFMRKARRRGCMFVDAWGEQQTCISDGMATPAGVHERVRAAGGL